MKLSESITEEGIWKQIEDAYAMWDAMAECIQRLAKEILSISRKGGSKIKGA